MEVYLQVLKPSPILCVVSGSCPCTQCDQLSCTAAILDLSPVSQNKPFLLLVRFLVPSDKSNVGSWDQE